MTLFLVECIVVEMQSKLILTNVSSQSSVYRLADSKLKLYLKLNTMCSDKRLLFILKHKCFFFLRSELLDLLLFHIELFMLFDLVYNCYEGHTIVNFVRKEHFLVL